MFCRLVMCSANNEHISNSFVLQIESDLSWSLYFYRHHINVSASQVFEALSQRITSAADVRCVILTLEQCVICEGNPDDKFLPLATARKNTFKDQTGS